MQRSTRKSGWLFNVTLLLSLSLILLGVGVMALWFYVFTHFPESCELSSATNEAPPLELWLNNWLFNLLPGLSLFILGYFIPKRLPKRRQPGFCVLGWLVLLLSTIWAVGWNIAFVIVGCIGFFPSQS